MQRERRAGTLELVVAAPHPVLAGASLPITAGDGDASGSTAWSPRSCGTGGSSTSRCRSQNWPVFVLSILMATVTIALFGFLLVGDRGALPHVVGARRRAGVSRAGCSCGFVVPLDLLPDCPAAALVGAADRPGRSRRCGRRPTARAPGATWRICLARRAGLRARWPAWLGVTPLDAARRDATLALVVSGMTSCAIFFIGGLMSYRALFGWMNPWIFIPSLLVSPLCQILLFAYIGRSRRASATTSST